MKGKGPRLSRIQRVKDEWAPFAADFQDLPIHSLATGRLGYKWEDVEIENEKGEMSCCRPSRNLQNPNLRSTIRIVATCGGSGWKVIQVIDSRDGRPERRVLRCPCKAPTGAQKPKPRA